MCMAWHLYKCITNIFGMAVGDGEGKCAGKGRKLNMIVSLSVLW